MGGSVNCGSHWRRLFTLPAPFHVYGNCGDFSAITTCRFNCPARNMKICLKAVLMSWRWQRTRPYSPACEVFATIRISDICVFPWTMTRIYDLHEQFWHVVRLKIRADVQSCQHKTKPLLRTGFDLIISSGWLNSPPHPLFASHSR